MVGRSQFGFRLTGIPTHLTARRRGGGGPSARPSKRWSVGQGW